MTDLRTEAYTLPAADLGPENPLPVFRGKEDDSTFRLHESFPEDERKYIGWHTAYRVLPYRLQDGYNRDRKPRAFNAVVLENEHLRATFLPELGGHLASLVHKGEDRELLERNPVFQPANLALRNAWISGGIEWNAGQLGHSYFTCSSVFAARVEGPDGVPMLRLYEWDRVKRFPWQIDFYLPPDSPLLYARVRLVNPHDHEIAMYWWTNIAVSERPDCRVLFPADTALGFCEGRKIGLVELPAVLGKEASYPTNITFAQEMFARIPEGHRRWVAYLDKTGKGFFQTSTGRLRGRKMFCWGMNQGGRRWQEYLSEPGRAYIELQAGLARTQLESLPMPAHAEWTWTEAFGLLEAPPEEVHATDYAVARNAAGRAVDQALPSDRLESIHQGLAQGADQPPTEVLWRGAGWGALERRRLNVQGMDDPIPGALAFDKDSLGPDEQPWLNLLERGSLPERDPQEDPGKMMVQPEWMSLLETSIRVGRSDHWLAWWHLGVMKMEARDTEGAKAAWERSIRNCPSAWAYRNLAVLHEREGDKKTAREYLRRAWQIGPHMVPLAVEYARALIDDDALDDLCSFLEDMPPAIVQHERMRIIAAQAALHRRDFAQVERLFQGDFATIREGETTLTDIWFSLHEQRLAAEQSIPIDDALRKRVHREFPPPRHIDFRMAADVE